MFKKNFVKLSVFSLFLLFGLAFAGFNMVQSKKMTAEEYNNWISETYDFRFGKEKPFSPSNATSFNGKFIDPKNFISSARCGSCHTDMHPQWLQSAHRNSFREPFYTKNVNDLISQRNIAFTRHCESCHNPTALFSGALTDSPQFKSRPFDQEGVSCMVCHTIESVTGKGIGGYVMGQPALLQKEDGTKLIDVTDQQILDNVQDHKRAMMRPLMKKPEFCGACHKSQVPRELNDYKFFRAFAVADELQMSSFSKESPHPYYVRDKETCNSCHMEDEPTKYFDASAKDGTIASHRWAAANTALPAFYGYREQLDRVTNFLKDDKMGVDIFAITRQKQKGGKKELIAPVNHQDFKLKTGDMVTADVIVTNKNIGHSFPPELRDFYEAYIEFTITGPDGKILFKSGYIQPDGQLDESAHAYKTHLVKEDGTHNQLHFIWKTKVVAQNAAIPSGKSDLARYQFVIPENLSGQLRVNAKLQYRRFTRIYSDYALGKSVNLPIVTMAESDRTFNIGGENKKEPADPKAMPDWKRWNNYGIALFDQKQFAEASDAWDEVIDFKNEYRAFAYTNKALALMELSDWKNAEKLIDRALKLDADNLRAVFQRGKVKRVASDLDAAEADFKLVLAKYPRDRMTLQQLGELAKIKSEAVPPEQRDEQLKVAQGYYEQILAIDPEDLGAHYNLMLLYQKLGFRDKAREEAKIFQDLKDDPRTTPLASSFLQQNPYIGNESLPFHTHNLKLFEGVWEKENYKVDFPINLAAQ
ncbi:MAG: multiheme c-type cytochrome [Pyrinomonadaceae bacterium]